MADIANREDLEEWLDGRGHLDARIMAVRAVDRVLPFVCCTDGFSDDIETDVFRNEEGFSLTIDSREFRSEVLLLSFRAALLLSVAIFGRSKEVDDAIDHISEVFDEIAECTSGYSGAALNAIFYAICSWYTHSESAAINATMAILQTEEFYDEKLWRHGDRGIWKYAKNDADFLKDGKNILLESPLWPDGQPDLTLKAWTKTKVLLSKPEALEEDWSFWIEWYEGRQHGAPFVEDPLEKAVALIPNETWIAGPKAVSAAINLLKAKLE